MVYKFHVSKDLDLRAQNCFKITKHNIGKLYLQYSRARGVNYSRVIQDMHLQISAVGQLFSLWKSF